MFKEKGYLHLKGYFDHQKIYTEATKTISICKKIKWKFVKVYHNIFINNFINIFSINFPFNEKLNSNLYREFLKINLKKPVLESTGWKYFKITQIELQHNQKYNYQSNWHRDSKFSNLENVVAILYLQDANGFKLVPKDIESKVVEKKLFSKEKNYKGGYTNLPKEYFHQFDVKAGDVVIFDGGLLHQGSCKGERTQFFIRCKEINDDSFIDSNLKPDALLENIECISKDYNWNFFQNPYSLKKKIESLLHLIIYYLPIFKIIKYLIDFRKKNIHFHYSLLQK